MTTTKEAVKAVRAALEKATPGPWSDGGLDVTTEYGDIETWINGPDGEPLYCIATDECTVPASQTAQAWKNARQSQAVSDAALIVALRNNAEVLLAEAERAEKYDDLSARTRAHLHESAVALAELETRAEAAEKALAEVKAELADARAMLDEMKESPNA